MHETRRMPKLIHAKSYTSIYDIFGSNPFNNILYANGKKKCNTEYPVFHALCGDQEQQVKASYVSNQPPYITSERYNFLNRDLSYRSLVRSTSTIFCDLDEIVKKQSIDEELMSMTQKCKVHNDTTDLVKRKHLSGFLGNSEAIVQECATQINRKVKQPRDSAEIRSKKTKKHFPHDIYLSSEIFLRDNDYEDEPAQQVFHNTEISSNRKQKFWSYAKYRTEYTKPIPEEKKSNKKNKDKGNRIEDPCPCQLFSYACPCTDEKKSLTELAENSKSYTVAEQVTSTVIIRDKKNPKGKSRKKKHDSPKDNITNTSFEKKNKEETLKNDSQKYSDALNIDDQETLKSPPVSPDNNNNKQNSEKRRKQIVCPNCKEKIEITSSTEEENSKTNSLESANNKEIPPTTTYTLRQTLKQLRKNKDPEEIIECTHDPPCDLIPVCQMLPDPSSSPRPGVKSNSKKSSQPTVIRITKACRHHPPCTVVPSCQRTTVLKNNCEFIPPCLHHPRCVNLPLCVPLSKTVNLDDFRRNKGPMEVNHSPVSLYNQSPVDLRENLKCSHSPKCRYVPICRESLDDSVNYQFGTTPQVQNCEFASTYNYGKSPPPAPCSCSRSTKSCQYDCSDCKCNATAEHNSKESVSDAVIFIRDVGCQFQSKTYSPDGSLTRSKESSASFEYADMKMGNYYTGVHTLRCEDKYTNPRSRRDFYISSDSLSSDEIDEHCPSHGHRVNRSGFVPRNTPFVAACTTYPKPELVSNSACRMVRDAKGRKCNPSGHSPIPTISRRSFLKGKYKKMFSIKRRKRSKLSCISIRSKKVFCRPSHTCNV